MITLVISDGEGATTNVPLVLDDITIGRKEGNTIRLTERNISREHCRIQRVNGDYVVRDLQSYNGVLINGRRVENESKLKAGDELRIGDYTVAFKSDAAAQSKPPSVPMPVPPVPPPVGDAIDDRAEQEPTTLAPLPKAPARLVVLNSSLAGAEFALPERGEVVIGRGPELAVRIDHRSVSREHAKVVVDGGRSRIVDNGSANGVLVNSEKVGEATLSAGDIVELGDVVVRYVAAGENYTFDPIEARVALAGRRPRRRAQQWVFAAAILGVALVGAFLIVKRPASPSEGRIDVAAATEPTAEQAAVAVVVAPAGAAPSDDERIGSLLSACRQAVAGGRFAEGVAHANAALKLRPDAAEALACQQTARDNHEHEQMFVRAKAALESGDVESAWSELLGLPVQGAVSGRPEVQTTLESVAGRVLERAGDLSRRDAEQGAALARSVADREGVSGDLRDRARKALARAEAQRPAARPARAPEPAPRVTAARPRAAPTGASPMETASACLARGDNSCVVKALAGRAQTAQELGLLIETYRALGDAAAAQRNMALYVQRFPAARRAEAYRQQLARQGSP